MYSSTADHKSSTVSGARSQARQSESNSSITRLSDRDSDLFETKLLKNPGPVALQLASPSTALNHSTRLGRLIQSAAIQPKLTVGKPEDSYEREADQVADKVMTSQISIHPFRGRGINRQPEEKEEPIQTRALLQKQPEKEMEEEELIQPGLWVQRQTESEEEEEAVQTQWLIQRQPEEEEEEEEVQAGSLVQPQAEEEEDEETIQTALRSSQLQRQMEEEEEEQSIQPKPSIWRKLAAGIRYIVNLNEPKQKAREEIQTKSMSPGTAGSTTTSFDSSLASTKGGGFPLAAGTRAIMEPQIRADFGNVRLHTDSRAAQMNDRINAQAFTHGSHIYFNAGKYNPDTSEGQHLLAHELTHTVQQGASVQKRGRTKRNGGGSHPAIQRSWLGDAWNAVSGAVSGAVEFVADSLEAGLDWIKDQFRDFVREIPGYRLLAVVLGQDPISGTPVARNGRNFIEAGLDIIPFGNLFKRKLEQTGTLAEAATWLDNQIADLDISLTAILSDLNDFWSRLSLTDLGNPSGVLRRAANIIRRPISRIVTFAGNVATEFLRIVKNYVITELATFVRDNTRGYPLLTVILSKDPITDEPVERSGMNLIRGFMLLSAEGEEQLRQMEETGSLQRAADWIDGAVARLDLSWETLRNLFTQAWNLISIENLMNPPDTFRRLIALFAGPVGRIVNFVIEVGIKILEFIKDALLSLLASHARETRGYPLITVILGKDPFTEEPVERSPENIIHGFMSLMEGGEEQFQQMKVEHGTHLVCRISFRHLRLLPGLSDYSQNPSYDYLPLSGRCSKR
jgi:hypothetical protein